MKKPDIGEIAESNVTGYVLIVINLIIAWVLYSAGFFDQF